MLRRSKSSIRIKLLILMLSATLAALLVALAALAAYEIGNYKQQWISDLSTQAEILGRSSAAAILFNDHQNALHNLELLQARSKIIAAAIYDSSGTLFATYTRPGDPKQIFPAAVGNKIKIHDNRIELFKPIVENHQTLGTVYLLAQYDLWERLTDYLGILGSVMLISLLAAVIIWAWLEKAITQPIRDITQVARRVMEGREYTLPVTKTSNDEIGYLVDAFNNMLAEMGRSADALLAADRMKDQFIATLAHELRNPLAPISNALHLLEMAGDRPEVIANACEIMTRQLKQLVRLVDDLLDVSRIATGKLVLLKQSVELHRLVDVAVEIARPLIHSRGHHLEVMLPQDPVHFVGDETRLAQVLSNLLNNAAKYTDTGGHIVLRATAEGGEITITVTDNGRGMSPETQRDIFKMFSQGNTYPDQPSSGLGVGLALAQRLAEMHEGSIEAYSAGIGRGSRFTVRLPIKQDGGATALEPHRAAAGVMDQRILVVDDNQDFAASLGTILRARGHQVRVENRGADGLKAAQDFRPDLVFLDIGLPDMSGNEVAHQILRHHPGVLLVAISGWGQEADKQTAARAGFDSYIVKPLDPSQLDAIISRAARTRAQPDSGIVVSGGSY
jgi:signal transduction histidine kinase/ActR/RegA family two-component response regulator